MQMLVKVATRRRHGHTSAARRLRKNSATVSSMNANNRNGPLGLSQISNPLKRLDEKSVVRRPDSTAYSRIVQPSRNLAFRLLSSALRTNGEERHE